MFLGKDELVFDTANTTTSDNVGAYIRASDGTLIDQETVNAKKALDVKAYVSASDGTLITHTGTALDVNIASSSGGGLSVTGNVADDAADSGNPVKTGTRAVFGAVLPAISTTNDRADMLSDQYRRLLVNDTADVSVKETAVTVGTSAALLIAVASQLSGRVRLVVQNLGSKHVFLGSASVSTSNGMRLAPSSTFEVELGPDVGLYAVSTNAGQDVRVLEFA